MEGNVISVPQKVKRCTECTYLNALTATRCALCGGVNWQDDVIQVVEEEQKLPDCQVCLSPSEDGMRCKENNDHLVCHSCVLKVFCHADLGSKRLKCPWCEERWPLERINLFANALPKQERDALPYLDRKIQNAVEAQVREAIMKETRIHGGTAWPVRCPKCATVAIGDIIDDDYFKCISDHCATRICKHKGCGRVYHPAQTCEQVRDSLNTPASRRNATLLKLAGQITCGNCSAPMFRASGCAKMTCPADDCGWFSCAGGCGLSTQDETVIYNHIQFCRVHDEDAPRCNDNPHCTHCPFNGKSSKCSNCNQPVSIFPDDALPSCYTCSEVQDTAHLVCSNCITSSTDDSTCPVTGCNNIIHAEDVQVNVLGDATES